MSTQESVEFVLSEFEDERPEAEVTIHSGVLAVD